MKRLSNKPGFRSAATVCAAVLVCLAVAGCGRKGPLEAHPDDRAGRQANQPGDEAGGKKYSLGSRNKTLASPIKPPDRPFILDALL